MAFDDREWQGGGGWSYKKMVTNKKLVILMNDIEHDTQLAWSECECNVAVRNLEKVQFFKKRKKCKELIY